MNLLTLVGKMILSVVNLKGGVGKSNLCQNIAAAFAQKDGQVLIADLDSQATTTHWFNRRQRATNPNQLLPIEVQQEPHSMTRRRAERLSRGCAHVILDSAAHDREIALAAMTSSDLIIVPLPPYPDDFDGTQQTVEYYQTLRKRRRKLGALVILINRVRSNERIAKAIMERINGQWRDHTVRHTISQRVEFPNASDLGKTVVETQQTGVAAREVMAVAADLKSWKF